MTFCDFFLKATGTPPFPYQASLAEADLSRLALAAPTGAGKTAAATLAWLWKLKNDPITTPRRLVICEPMRTLVEQVYVEVETWLKRLGLNEEIKVYPLLGGYKDEGWELHPEQTAIIVGTQDQLLSRALNRGYAMSRFRWPIPFGLLNNDTQWVFDEIQLMGPGLTTSAQLHGLREKLKTTGNVGTLWMSATLNPQWLSTIDHVVDNGGHRLQIHPFTKEDRANEMMSRRLHAHKPLSQLAIPFDKSYVAKLAKSLEELHRPGRFTLVIVNTVERARELHKHLSKAKLPDPIHLLHSRFRPNDRRQILNQVIAPRVGKIVISTQVVEAGVDISADTLVTELAPWSALIQRFGRCNRRGDLQDAQVYWIDLPDDKAAPYEAEEFQKARGHLAELSSVEPAQFPDNVDDPWPTYDTLRRRDLLELFNTTGDLSGLDIDIGRFIRDGDDRDVFLFWRNWTTEKPPLETKVPGKNEICSVSKFQVLDLVRKKSLEIWYLDDLQQKGQVADWKQARPQDIVTGRTYLVHSSQGCYSPDTGWSPDSKQPVPEAEQDTDSPFPAMASDPRSESSYLTLEAHTSNVCTELSKVLEPLTSIADEYSKQLETAAKYHDWGKAHPVFQETMRKGLQTDDEPDTLWAKRKGGAHHSRRYFRHEFASALACLQMGQPFLVCYLIAAHHGKARTSIRAFPDELNDATLGVKESDQLPAVPFLNAQPVDLSLAPLKLGRGSWQDQALQLLADLGPFRLAYLEALLRAADVRASIAEKAKGEPIHA